MGSRYLVTGVQLGMLVGLEDIGKRNDLVNKICEEQWIGNSSRNISKDCKRVSKKGVIIN